MYLEYYNFKTGQMRRSKQSSSLRFFYRNPIGRLLMKIYKCKIFSKIGGFFRKLKISTFFIPGFIKRHKINMTDYEKRKYKSFDDFFTRKVKKDARPYSENIDDLMAIADAKVSAFFIESDLSLRIKDSVYSLEALLQNHLPTKYIGGNCVVFRLGSDDCHRYSFFDNGELISTKKIDGFLHSVNPVAYERYKVFLENQREVSLLLTEHYGPVIQVEVGSLNVGKIHNRNKRFFKKGEEKGYFSYGGSTIILIFEKGIVDIDDNIERFTDTDIEVEVNLGETIGKRIK